MRPPSVTAIVVLVIVVLLLFGASKLPDIAGSIGKSLKVFKKEVRELRDDDGAPAARPTSEPGTDHDARTAPHDRDTDPGRPPADGSAGDPRVGRAGEGHLPPQP